jgi:hypothetical protein
MRVRVKHVEGSLFQVQGNTSIHEVDIDKKSCTCIQFKKGRQCKNIKAVVFKAAKVISGEIAYEFVEIKWLKVEIGFKAGANVLRLCFLPLFVTFSYVHS